MKKLLLTCACAAFLAACDQGGVSEQVAEPVALASGIDATGFDTNVRPQDDFFQYVNGGWIANTEIPPDQIRWGSFNILRDEADAAQRAIIEELGARTDLVAGSEEQKIGDLYASLMDEEHINALGAEPLAPYFAAIDAIGSSSELVQYWAEMRKFGIGMPFLMFVNGDSADSTKYAVYLTQSGLGLPNRNYYLQDNEKFNQVRAAYPGYIAQLLELAGFDNAADRAAAIYDLEMKIATAHWTPEDNRDATKTNNRYAVADLESVSGAVDWGAFLAAADIADSADLFVRQPSYIEKLGGIIDETPLEVWKDYMRFHLIDSAADWLSQPFFDANFEFFGKLVNGQQEPRPRWKRSVGAVNGSIGEAVGKVYVARHFPPEAKARMQDLVGNLLEAFRVSIDGLDWMSEETKAKAQEKRGKFMTKIGYTDKWKDYSDLEISRDDALGNLARAARWDYQQDIDKLGGPVDRTEWFMTPQTVNAYHNPRMNEIVFPAAILQPPFFNMEADDAVNYGAIGAVIGHEIGHAFDDQGRKTDSDGNLNDWWTSEDATAFEAKAAALVGQYNGFEVLPDLFVNGQLTLGENIGDLTGVYIGYLAYQMSLDGKEAPVIDGLTGDQRFFMGYGQIWRAKAREEFLYRQVATDPHSPSPFRGNGPLRNFEAFYKAFDVHEGDGMWLPPEERVQIW